MYYFKALDPNVEMSGGHLFAFLNAFPPRTQQTAKEILDARGMGSPDPEKWYLLQPFLDAMKEVSDRLGPPMLRRVGFEVIQRVPLPPHWSSLEVAFGELDVGYHMNHRKGEIGAYECHNLGVEHGLHRIKMVVSTHWPCKYEHGILDGMAHRFRPVGIMDIVVREVEDAPCRMHGGGSCTYLVTWC